MGSDNSTCMLTDIGIGSGDRIACVLLQEGNYGQEPNQNWNPISTLLMGEYKGSGRIKLDEDHRAFLAHLKPWVMPVGAGANPYYEHAVNPDDLSWDLLEEADREDRLLLYADDKDVPAFAGAREAEAAERAEMDMRMAERYGIPVPDPRTPFQRIQDALEAADPKGFGHLHAVDSTGLFAIDLSRSIKNGDPRITQVRDALAPIGYSAHVIPATGVAYANGTLPEDHQVGLLVAPSPGTTNPLDFRGERSTVGSVRAKRGFIRLDVLEALFPVDERTIKRAGLLRELRRNTKYHGDAYSQDLKGYMFSNAMGSMGSLEYKNSDGLKFSSEESTADRDHIAPQIMAMPEDAPIEAYIPWVRLANVVNVAKGSMRRGLRPPVQFVGSHSASEDWAHQLKYHREMSGLLVSVIKNMKAKHKRRA